MNTTSKMMVSGILAILVVTLSSGSYSITQVNAQDPCSEPPSQQQEQACQEAMQKQDCMQLQAKMANDAQAGQQYESKKCADLEINIIYASTFFRDEYFQRMNNEEYFPFSSF